MSASVGDALQAPGRAPKTIPLQQFLKGEKRGSLPIAQRREPDVANRPICPSAQYCANGEARIRVLENEVGRLRGLDSIRQEVANLLQEEIDELRAKLLAIDEAKKSDDRFRPAEGGDDRFRQAKVAISKVLHPNNFGHDRIAATIRGEIFKELWPEIERIERK